jgi:nucleoside 2-deoxyribosyltransferase
MKNGTIYLIGPISGCTFTEATQWRNDLQIPLAQNGWTVLDPMRGKNHLSAEEKIVLSYEDHIVSRSDSIFQTDLFRVRQADVLLCNLTSMPGHSIGTFMEMGYGHALGKIIIVIANDPMVVKHPFIVNSSIVVSTVEEALQVLHNI